MKMEEFIDKKRKQQNDLIFKSSKFFKFIKANNDEDDEINGFLDKYDIKNQVNEKDSIIDSQEVENDNNVDNNNKHSNDKEDNDKKNKLKNKMNNSSNGKNDFQRIKEKRMMITKTICKINPPR